jgi:hypothetical protein
VSQIYKGRKYGEKEQILNIFFIHVGLISPKKIKFFAKTHSKCYVIFQSEKTAGSHVLYTVEIFQLRKIYFHIVWHFPFCANLAKQGWKISDLNAFFKPEEISPTKDVAEQFPKKLFV